VPVTLFTETCRIDHCCHELVVMPRYQQRTTKMSPIDLTDWD